MYIITRFAQAPTFYSVRKYRNFRLYFTGQIISMTGTWMQATALAWLVLELTHSAVAVGFLVFCEFGPSCLLGPFSGALGDNFAVSKRTLMVFTQSGAMLAALALTLLTLSGRVNYAEILLLVSMLGFINVIEAPFRQMLVIETVGRDEVPNAVSLVHTVFNLARTVGPALAGLIIARWGVGACFSINSLSFLGVIACLVKMRHRELRLHAYPEQRERLLHSIGEGFQFCVKDPRIRMVLVMMLLISTVGVNFSVLIPLLSAQTLRADALVFGGLAAAFGIGSMLGAAMVASSRTSNIKYMFLTGIAFGIGELLLGLPLTVLTAAILLTLTGLTWSAYAAISNGLIQLWVPDRLRGRVIGVFQWTLYGTTPIGSVLTSWICANRGTRTAFAVEGAVICASIVLGATLGGLNN